MALFAGIDPGASGGIGIIDHSGTYVTSSRWLKRDPQSLFKLLTDNQEALESVLIEVVGIFPGLGIARANTMQSLLINAGIWRGWLIALGLSWGEIHPAAWQSRHGITHWQSKQRKGVACQSPLDLARTLWPDAPLRYQLDDGIAVGLLLAEVARRESQVSRQDINRA